MYKRIHHLGIAVRNLDKTVMFHKDILGLAFEKEVDWDDLGLKAAVFIIGESRLEFIQAIDPKGKVAQAVADAARVKDGAIHHLCYAVDNIEEEVESLLSKGVDMIDEKPKETEGGKVAWLGEKTIEGFMIELVGENYEIS